MTRRDRAALVLALECLRERCSIRTAQDALCFTDCSPYLPPIIHEAIYGATPPRLLRARLALLLRALLRADAGYTAHSFWIGGTEVMPWSEVLCGTSTYEPLTYGQAQFFVKKHGGEIRRVCPLWEQAPSGTRRVVR